MIIYGTNGTHLRDEPLPGIPCPACQTTDALKVSVYGRYAHVYWLPLLPYRKPAVLSCGHCRHGWDEKTLPAEMKAPVAALKKETRAPWWHWSGLVVIALLISWGTVAAARHNRDKVDYLAAPRVGDIYTVRDSVGGRNYTLLKVVRVRGNIVGIVENEYQLNNSHPIDELNAPGKYRNEYFSVTFDDLQRLQASGQLTDIDRTDEQPTGPLIEQTAEPTTAPPTSL